MQENPYNSMNTKERLACAVETHGDMLFRVALNMLGNIQDAEDATQETYLRYMKYEPELENVETEKYWLLRVCINVCKNMQKRKNRRCTLSIEELSVTLDFHDEEKLCVIESIMSLPEKYRTVMDLHYIEGIDTESIAKMLSISSAAVRKRLQYAREKLKIALGETKNYTGG